MKIFIELSPPNNPNPLAMEQLLHWAAEVEGTYVSSDQPDSVVIQPASVKANGELTVPAESPSAGTAPVVISQPPPSSTKRIAPTNIKATDRIETPWGKMAASSAADKAGFSFTTLKKRFAAGGTLDELYAEAVRGRRPSAPVASEPAAPPPAGPTSVLPPGIDAQGTATMPPGVQPTTALPPGVQPAAALPPGVQAPAMPAATAGPGLPLREQVRALIVEVQQVKAMAPSRMMHGATWESDDTPKPRWDALAAVPDDYLPRLQQELNIFLQASH